MSLQNKNIIISILLFILLFYILEYGNKQMVIFWVVLEILWTGLIVNSKLKELNK